MKSWTVVLLLNQYTNQYVSYFEIWNVVSFQLNFLIKLWTIPSDCLTLNKSQELRRNWGLLQSNSLKIQVKGILCNYSSRTYSSWISVVCFSFCCLQSQFAYASLLVCVHQKHLVCIALIQYFLLIHYSYPAINTTKYINHRS